MAANLANEQFFLRLISLGKLKVTKAGRAFNLVSAKEIAKSTSSSGYRKLSWQDPKTKKIRQIQLHRLIWAFFKGVPGDRTLQLNHLDGDKSNCRLRNLELTNNSGNTQHAHDTGLQPSCKGECNSQSKFLDRQVFSIRKRFSKGLYSVEQIAARFDVHELTVVNILSGKTYPHVISGFEEKCRLLLAVPKPRISEKVIARIKRLRLLGNSGYSISELTGLSRTTVMKYW